MSRHLPAADVDDDVVTAFLRLNQESYSAESRIDEFSEAVISNDVPTVIKLFESIEVDQQNQYVKKLDDLTNMYAEKNNVSVLLIWHKRHHSYKRLFFALGSD